VICAACRLTRDPADLLVFWPLGQPEVRRFVCRPTRPHPGAFGPCFGRAVGPVSIHGIALLTPLPAAIVEPIRPLTDAWFGLMREAGVRAA
jgi:hypothetical protein